jgi:C-terminal processing protease CtpA/Prc
MTQRVPRPLRLFLFLLFLWAAAFPALASSPHPALSRQEAVAKDSLSAKDRKEILARVWKDIADLYYDPAFNGVDWNEVRKKYEPLAAAARSDAAFYDLMKHMVEELHDAHTRFSTPSEWEYRQKHESVSLGFGVDRVEGKTVVTTVTADSQAANNGIAPGLILLAVDDHSIESLLADVEAKHARNSSERADLLLAYRNILGGPAGSVAKLQFQRADGSAWETSITREVRTFPPKVIQKRLPDGIAYIRFDEFQRPDCGSSRQWRRHARFHVANRRIPAARPHALCS